MESLFDQIRQIIFDTAGLDKDIAKSFFFDAGLGWIWNFTRDYLLNFHMWFFIVVPLLLIERYRPALRDKNPINKSLILDGIYPLLTLPIKVFIISGIVVSIDQFYSNYIPFANSRILDDQPLWIQAIGIFLITDLMFYVSHRISHEVPWLWHFHAIHHSQRDLNPLTTKRAHPVEGIFKTAIRTIPIGFVGGEPTTWVVFLFLNGFWGFFIHSNVRTNLGFLKYIIVTPQYHRVHHSIEPEHFDQNYGERLIIWDFLFGTLHKDFSAYPNTGVKNTEWILERSAKPTELFRAWLCQMIYPFYKIKESLVYAAKRKTLLAEKTEDSSG